MYGQSQLILKEWSMLDKIKPPRQVFRGSDIQWKSMTPIARRTVWEKFKNKSISTKDQFSSFFSQKNGYWFFDFDGLKFKSEKRTSRDQQREKELIAKQMQLKEKMQQEQEKMETFVPSATSVAVQMPKEEERPLRIVNTPTVSTSVEDEKPLVLVDTDIKSPQMPMEQAPILPLEQASVEQVPTQAPPQVQEQIVYDMVTEKKDSKLPLIIGGAILSLVLYKTLK